MILGIVVILLVGLVAYFHYLQGLLGGVISAVCAAIAAALALGFHENVIDMIAQGKMADQTHALVLVGMFALIYLILRVIFDKLIPGNIRFPAIADKIGGAVMGLIAGVFAIGILMIAAQTLPFGPSIAGYSRWEIENREVKIPTGRGPQLDASTYDELKSNDPIKAEDHGASMLLPVDDMVINFVNKLSDGGSLAGERTLASVHPSYNDESFFQRLGIQLGAKHVAMNTAKQKQADVEGVYFIQQVPQGEAEIGDIRRRENLKPLQSNASRAIIVVRVQFTENASDSDKRIRLAPVGVRMVAGGKNYLPEGTLDPQAGVVYANKPDDFLLIEPNKPVDFVFNVAREDVLKNSGAKPAEKEMEVADGVFVEIKRLVRVNLAGKKVSTTIESSESGVIRKADSGASKVQGVSLNAGAPSVAPPTAPEKPATPPATNAPATPAPTPPPAPAADKGAFKFVSSSTGVKLFAPVSVGKAAAESTEDVEQELNSGKAFMKAKKIARLELHKTDETLEEVGTGTGKVTNLFIPAGKMMVQVTGTALEADAWRWAEHLSEIEVLDDKGTKFKPHGALAKATKDGKTFLIGKYDAENAPNNIDKYDVTPTEVHLFFIVPEKTAIKSINYQGEKMADLKVGG